MAFNDKIIYTIEPAAESHIHDIAAINLACWQHNFDDVFEARYLREIDIRLFQDRWHQSYGQNKFQNTFVAVRNDGHVVGFISVGRSRDPEFTGLGEVYAIYVEPQYQFQGIGKSLWKQGVYQLASLGFKEFYVWTVGGYFSGLRFFRAQGARFEKTRFIKIASRQYFEICYTFKV